MLEKMKDLYETVSYATNGVLAVICVIFCTILGIGIGVGLLLLMAWVIMSVYNVLAETWGWPTFSIWFWLGMELIINWLRTGKLPITMNIKKKDK